MQKKFPDLTLMHSPEFLREGEGINDNLNPSRIIVGCDNEVEALDFANILSDCSEKKQDLIMTMKSSESESVKLFSNFYLAMRVAFFNEVDTYAMESNLNVKQIIDGISSDNRIGNFYNNPSFGYGGYCLPKDTKALKGYLTKNASTLIDATILSNSVRKNFLSNYILKKNIKEVGIYRLSMKKDSKNFRDSAVLDVMNLISDMGVKVIIYEPFLD